MAEFPKDNFGKQMKKDKAKVCRRRKHCGGCPYRSECDEEAFLNSLSDCDYD